MALKKRTIKVHEKKKTMKYGTYYPDIKTFKFEESIQHTLIRSHWGHTIQVKDYEEAVKHGVLTFVFEDSKTPAKFSMSAETFDKNKSNYYNDVCGRQYIIKTHHWLDKDGRTMYDYMGAMGWLPQK